ncbi:MAG: tRNA (adenosine(37)-N6)-threonylcarbamoyltransferase complex ATPase subunit type 1 TsaE [Pseudomonadota bacterium]
MAFPSTDRVETHGSDTGAETGAPTEGADAARDALARAATPGVGAATLLLRSEAATERFGQIIAGTLAPGDAVLLSGTLGAGKSALARSVVRSLLRDPAAEVPSPSYTLINVYEPAGAPPVWHADLYRLGDSSELDELGLEDAFASAICLVEWPDRLPNLPPRRLLIRLELPADALADDVRMASITAVGPWPRLETLAP